MNGSSKADPVKIVRFDWAMKSLLRDKANFEILEGFLQSLIGETLVIDEILESESNADSDSGRVNRVNRVDLMARDSEGRTVIVEIQNEREKDYIERMLFGTSKHVVESVSKGKTYGEIPKIFSVHILYFNLGQGTDYIYSGTTELRGVHTDEPLLVSEHFTDESGTTRVRERDVFPEYFVINVERFNKMDQEDLEMLDQWIYLFKESEVRGDFDAPGINTAREKLAFLKMNDAERRKYERFMDDCIREVDILATAKEEGIEEGKRLEAHASAKVIIEKLFGEIPGPVAVLLEQASFETLKDLVHDAWDLKTMDGVADFLKRK